MSVESVHAARLTAGVDLRKTDCHPDFWYPIAWSDEVKAGAMIARTYAGEPVAVVRAIMAPALTSSDQAIGYQKSGWQSVLRKSTPAVRRARNTRPAS